MFKLILHTVLGLSMLISSMGIGVYKHYCHQQHVGTTLFFKVENCCGGKKMPPNCCHDEFELLQLDEDYHASEALVLPSISLISNVISPPNIELPKEVELAQDFKLFHFRPPLIHLDLSVWNQTFLI